MTLRSLPEKVEHELNSLLGRLHVLVIGPGLGREPYMLSFARLALSLARTQGMYLVLDADALWLIGQQLSLIKGYRRAVLTPNVVEFKRLSEQVGLDSKIPAGKRADFISQSLGGVTVLQKGARDIIAVNASGAAADLKASKLEGADEAKESVQESIEVDTPGGLKRCGGQGDVLSGCVGTFLAWGKCYETGEFGYVLCMQYSATLAHVYSDKAVPTSRIPFLAAIGGSIVTRTASRRAFSIQGRSLVTQDMIPQIGKSFDEVFDEVVLQLQGDEDSEEQHEQGRL